MKIPVNTLIVSSFDVCVITKANLPALVPEVPAIPARHKKSWIRTKDDLSSLLNLGRFASFGGLSCLPGQRTLCSRRRQDDSRDVSKFRRGLLP
jgi:hypothetical protein